MAAPDPELTALVRELRTGAEARLAASQDSLRQVLAMQAIDAQRAEDLANDVHFYSRLVTVLGDDSIFMD